MKRTISLILCLVMVCSVVMLSSALVDAKLIKKSGWYSGGNASAYRNHFNNRITKVKYSGNKVTVKGGLYCSSTTWTKRGTMTFKIASNCKFYKNNKKISKSKFKRSTSPLRKNNHFTLQVKNKKVVKMMYLTSVMA